MPTSFPEQERLKQAIESTLVQLCQLRVSYTEEILIEGTLGVTADKQNLLVIHFSNRIQQPLPDIDTSQKELVDTDAVSVYMPTIVTSPESTIVSSHEASTSASMRLSGAETLFSLHDYLNKPTSFSDKSLCRDNLTDPNDPSKMSLAFPDTISIDIDSDTDSFSALPFDDYDSQNDKSKVFSAESDKVDDSKSVITINEDDKNSEYLALRGEDPSLGLGAEQSSVTVQDTPQQLQQRHYGIATKNLKAMEDEAATSTEFSTSPEKKTVRAVVRKHPLLTCEVCGREFTNNGLLESHLVGTHGVTETKRLGQITHFQCPYCPKKYRYQATLDKHINRHRNSGADKTHRCKLCRNAYRTAESLSIHQSLHRAEKVGSVGQGMVLECVVCDKQYSNKVLLQKHIIYMHETRRKSAQKRSRESDEDNDELT